MSFLTIAGITIPVSLDGAQETIERIGSESRAYAGNLRSTVRSERRSWTIRTRALTSGEEAPIRAAIANGVFAAVAGDLTGFLTCSVAITDATAVKVTGGFRNALTLSVKQT